jgi:hypothetical protein
VEELVYSRHLKCLGFGHAGSNPAARTTGKRPSRKNVKEFRMNKLIVIVALLAIAGCAGSPMRLETRGDEGASNAAALQEGARRAMETRTHDGRSE